MELIFAIGGFVGGICACVIWIRRARSHPNGKTAKAANVIFGGGGPGSGVTPR